MESPNIKNLRVIVIPTETGNDIDQSSSYDEIMECKEKLMYKVPDYFQAQNDEELPLLHWSFLVDIANRQELTGLDF